MSRPAGRAPAPFVGLVLGLLLAVGLTGCVGLPDDGPVVQAQTSGSGNRSDAMAINPLGPQPGQSRSEVVKGFLDAMQATPIRDDVAREFLTDDARDRWRPERTIVFDDVSLPRPSAEAINLVDVTVIGADQIDERGSWQGALEPDRTDPELSFTVVPDGDEFRIAGPPDALIVPQDWYAERFRQVSLYFFDPTSQVLVPDPVFVPRGVDLATILVQRLVVGPSPELSGYARNLLPAGTDPDVTVGVSDDGVATVDLTGDVAMPSPADRGLLVAQLAWTLRQDPSVDRLRVQVDGESVTPLAEPEVSVTTGEAFAPYVADANALLFGLDEGRLAAGAAQSLVAVNGPFGTGDLDLRTITPDLDAEKAAGVTAGGSTMLVGPVRASETGEDTLASVVTGATDLLPPAWDFSGRLWIVDRQADGAAVSYLRDGETEAITIPRVSGEDVKSFLVSRDGSRFVAVIRGAVEDEIVVSRLLQDDEGRFAKALAAKRVDVEDGLGLRIRDIAWLSPTSVVVLHPVGELFQVRTASVDGAPGDVDDLALTLDSRVTGLAGTPNPSQSTYAIVKDADRSGLIDLSGPTGGFLEVDPEITSLGYVG